MRPDLYYRMVEAYYYRQQKECVPIRRLSAIVSNLMRGEDDEITKESDIHWLSMIDEPPKPKKKSEPIVWSDERLQQFYTEYGIKPPAPKGE